jgi:hypothetical protein
LVSILDLAFVSALAPALDFLARPALPAMVLSVADA